MTINNHLYDENGMLIERKAREDVAILKQLAGGGGMFPRVRCMPGCWVGWNQYGALVVRGEEHDIRISYSRSRMAFTHNDSDVHRVRTGSSKHCAIRAAIQVLAPYKKAA